MKTYLEALDTVLNTGKLKTDRTGVGTKSLFGVHLRFDLQKGFPAVTTKKLAWKAVVSELLWFLEGSGDERRLREILHGDRNSEKPTIWTANAEADYWTPKAKEPGDLGRIYGVQWRNWIVSKIDNDSQVTQVDQLTRLIDGIKTDPHGRRHILSAWNPGELEQMALPPCHVLCQFDVTDNKLSCQMYQRSGDAYLGVPFNIASYALLTHMIAQVCNLDVGEFIHVIGDFHLYLNHENQAREQLSREPLTLPSLWLNPDINTIDKFTMNDIKLVDYNCYGSIPAPMAV